MILMLNIVNDIVRLFQKDDTSELMRIIYEPCEIVSAPENKLIFLFNCTVVTAVGIDLKCQI